MKRHLPGTVLLLFLLVNLSPSFAKEAPDCGYLWYVEEGKLLYDQEYRYTGYSGDRLYISDDQGVSYVELPELYKASRKNWENYSHLIHLTPLSNGGLRVEARGGVGFRRDYTARELARLFQGQRMMTPIEVLRTNGEITVATREVKSTRNGDWDRPATAAWSYQQAEVQDLWSTDGVTWMVGQAPVEIDREGLKRYSTTIGPYRFEIMDNNVYLLKEEGVDQGVLLPHMGDAIREKELSVRSIRAWYGPNKESVFLAVYDDGYDPRQMFCLEYPISSLDWCLENLSVSFREIEALADSGKVRLGIAKTGYLGNGYREEAVMVRDDGSGWRRVEDTPFSDAFSLLPYNGRTFIAREDSWIDTRGLYISEDGLSWTYLPGTDPYDRRPEYCTGPLENSCAMTWAGGRYIVARRVAEKYDAADSIYGSAVGGWTDPVSTLVEFWDEEFRLLDSYDFGRLVEAVGWYEGAWYAQASNSKAIIYTDFDWDAGSTLYRSQDGKTWFPTEKWEIWNCLAFLEEEEELPLITPEQTSRTGPDGWAGVGEYRFYLMGDTLYMRKQGDQHLYDGRWLRDSTDAIQAAWLTPHFLTAAYDSAGNVSITVRDRFTPSMSVTLTYTPEELEESWSGYGLGNERALVRGNGICLSAVEFGHPGDPQSILLRGVPAQEGEEAAEWIGHTPVKNIQLLEKVPWSGHIRLLPYTGKDFLLYDRESGDTYTSADGLTWKKLEGDWAEGLGVTVWTGKEYLACRDGEKTRDKVFLLDRDFDLTGSHAFPGTVEAVGYEGNIYYAKVKEGAVESI